MVKNTEINLSTLSRDLKKSPSDAVVIGVGQGTDGPVLLDNPLAAKSAEALTDSLKSLGVTGAADQIVRLPGLPETGAGILVLAGVGKVPAGTFGFDDSGSPKAWPMKLAKAHWAAVLPGLPAGEYTLRSRTIDENGQAQPRPRPFRKSGHAAIESISIKVAG